MIGAVLLTEYILISLRFDAQSVADRTGAWTWLSHLGTLAPLGVVLGTVLVLLQRRRNEAPHAAIPPLRPALLAAHALAFGAFFALTARVFGAAQAPPGAPALWIGAWIVLAAATAVTLIAGLFGAPGRWLQFGRVGAAVGALAVLAWIAGLASTLLWRPLSDATLQVVSAILRVPFPDVLVDAPELTLGLRGFSVIVAPECSGFEGIGLGSVLLAGYLVAFRKQLRFPAALLLLPLGIALVWFGNALRIAALIAVGALVDAELAYEAFHSKAGWVFFCAMVLAVAALGSRSRLFSREAELPRRELENPTAGYLVPLLVLVATALVTSLFAKGLDPLYPLRLVPAVLALYFLRRYYADLERRAALDSAVLGGLVGVLWLAIPELGAGAPPAEPGQSHPGVAWLAARVVGSVLVIPICEELAFRGYLLRRLIDRDFTAVAFKAWTPWALAASSLAFGLIHERWLSATLAGAVYALCQARRGRLADAVVAHASSNAVIAGWVLVTQDWSHWR